MIYANKHGMLHDFLHADIAEKRISQVPGFASRADNMGNTPLHLACIAGNNPAAVADKWYGCLPQEQR